MKKIIEFLTIVLIICSVSLNMAIAGSAHEEHEQTYLPALAITESTGSSGTFTHEAVVNHVRAEFKVMSLASMNMKDPNGATHHVMVKLFHDSEDHPIKNAIGKIKIIGPTGREQINNLKSYDGIFAANFLFNENGKYGLMCLVNVDGKKHLFKFWHQHG